MSSIIRNNLIDRRLLSLADAKLLETGGKHVFVSYNKDKLILETPQMVSPFGLSSYIGDKGEVGKTSIQLSLGREHERSPDLEDLYNSLCVFDDFVLDQACAKSLAWFTHKNLSKEAAAMLYTPTVKFPKDKATGEITDKFAPTFRAIVPTKDGKFAVPTFIISGSTHKRVDLESLDTRRAKVHAIVECTGLWIADRRFGATWKVVQLVVIPAETIEGFAFQKVAVDSSSSSVSAAADSISSLSIAGAGDGAVTMQDNSLFDPFRGSKNTSGGGDSAATTKRSSHGGGGGGNNDGVDEDDDDDDDITFC